MMTPSTRPLRTTRGASPPRPRGVGWITTPHSDAYRYKGDNETALELFEQGLAGLLGVVGADDARVLELHIDVAGGGVP